jgi:hypothetical protein
VVGADTTPAVDHRAATLAAVITCAHLTAHLDPDLKVDLNITSSHAIHVQLFNSRRTRPITLQDLTRLADALGLEERAGRMVEDTYHHRYIGSFRGHQVDVVWLDQMPAPVPPLAEDHVEQLLVDAGVQPPRAEQVLPAGYRPPSLAHSTACVTSLDPCADCQAARELTVSA